MKLGRSICRGLLVISKILVILEVFLFCIEGTSAVLENPLEHNWDVCMYEEWGEGLCNPGESKNYPTSGCSARRPCCTCPVGTFMDRHNNCSRCKPWRDCHAEGKEVVFEGNTTVDAKCGRDLLTTVEHMATTTLPPSIEGAASPTSTSYAKDESVSNSTTPSPSGDDANKGTNVLKLDGGSVLVIILCSFLVLALVVIVLFIIIPKIPGELNRILCHRCRSNKRPDTNSYVLTQVTDQGGGSKITTV